MDDLQAYTPEEIILSNLSELTERQTVLFELLRAHLRELATELSEELRDGAAFLAALADHGAELAQILPKETADTAYALLALELRRLLPSGGSIWQDWFFSGVGDVSLDAHNRIAYQRSSYTDEAFARFSPLLRDARAAYPHTFRAVCDEVVSGNCEYCILPLESSGEGRLRAFTSLVDAYDLKIAAACSVSLGDGRVTQYALLRHGLAILRPNEEVPRHLEIRCDTSGRSPDGLLHGARLCGLPPVRVDWSNERLNALFAPGGDIPAFLLFLSLAYPHFEIIGLFRHLL